MTHKNWLMIIASVLLGAVLLFLKPGLISVLIMLALISSLVIAHEWGHFTVARKVGIRVERFGFGLPFGPTLYEKKVGHTTYCVHAALLGGYVSFPDDNPDSDVPLDSNERFENKPAWARLAVVCAGVVINAILGYALMASVIGFWGLPGAIEVVRVLPNHPPAAAAGIQANDLIVRLNNQPVMLLESFSGVVKQYKEKPLQLTIERNHELKVITLTPNKDGMIGIELKPKHHFSRVPVGEVLPRTNHFITQFLVLNAKALGEVFNGTRSTKDLAGPIGIIKQGSDAIDRNGIAVGLQLTALISIILAVMNILPIPMLDGGHVLFILIELLRGGKPLNKAIQERVTQVCFVGLMGLTVLVLFNDIKTHLLGL